MTSASAPGKIILFGEHAVVYGRPALAAPVTQLQTDVEVRDAARPGVHLEAPAIRLKAELKKLQPDHPLAAIINTLSAALGISALPPLDIKINSTIPVASGLGSGAAVSVALIRALSAHLGQPLPDEEVNKLAFEIEKLHHGTPSGIDNTTVTYAEPVYFVKGQPVERLRVGAAFTIVIADTGLPAPTKRSVADVRKLWEADKAGWERVFDRIGEIAREARAAIEGGNIAALGPLMDENHFWLRELTVSSPEMDHLVAAAWSAGAEGAKVSGGGRGGNMIALARPELAESMAAFMKEKGAKRTIVTEILP
jgi:mevalonate kinase